MKPPQQRSPGKRGPRASPGDARAEILAAARAEFAERGFEGTTLRAIATSAGVDVALVSYYFKTKAELFIAALELPVNPAAALRGILATGPEGAGTRILSTLLQVWDEPTSGAPLAALLRSLPTQTAMAQDFIGQQLILTVADAIEGPGAELRASAFVGQILGLVLERYVIGVEPLASASHDQIVELIGPTLQRYLTG